MELGAAQAVVGERPETAVEVASWAINGAVDLGTGVDRGTRTHGDVAALIGGWRLLVGSVDVAIGLDLDEVAAAGQVVVRCTLGCLGWCNTEYELISS